jgi:hypothetical protein
LLPWFDFVSFLDNPSISVVTPPNQQFINQFIGEPFAKFARKRDLLSGRVVVPGKPMASQVQIPFEGVILQEHSAPISCPTPNFAKGSTVSFDVASDPVRNAG